MKKLKRLSTGLLISALLLSTNAFSALSSYTSNFITGNAPEVLEATLETFRGNIYFTVADQSGATYDIRPNTSDQVYLPLESIFKNITPNLDSSFLTNNDIYDADGDQLSSTNPITIKSISYLWKDKNSAIIANNSSSSLGADICVNASNYPGPYTLDVSFNMLVNTEFGLPSFVEIVIEKTFTVNADDGICYIRPGVLALNIRNGWPEGSEHLSSGGRNKIQRDPAFDSTVFVQNAGFKAWAEDKFPTMAFPEARFQIVPYQNVSNYTISLKENPNGALVDQQQYAQGQFKFGDNRPDQGSIYTIEVKNNVSNLSYYYSFKLKSSRSWFVVGQTATPTAHKKYDEAVTTCNDLGASVPMRTELSNSIYATTSDSPGDYATNNGYSRAIGNLTAEWGAIYYYAPRSTGDKYDMMKTVTGNLLQDFDYWYYWTQDSYSASNNYLVGLVEGNVRQVAQSGDGRILCVY